MIRFRRLIKNNKQSSNTLKNQKIHFYFMQPSIEIMAPAGSFASMRAALNAGCDSVYFGVAQLNMRARSANNFVLDDLEKISEICKKKNVKTYLTVNTILYNHDINLMKKICDEAKKHHITAIIASDVAAIQYANSIDLTVHISTQANVTNIETVKFYSQYADVMVLARELTLDQIKDIISQVKKEKILGPKGELVRIEVFAHGALCVAISGKCYMSLATNHASANRGACVQNCRRSYRVVDDETGEELKIDNKYIMSPKDLCTIPFLDQLLDVGVSVLKIEGRGRSPEYVSTVVRVYKEGVEAYLNKTFTKEKTKEWVKQLETVYNRGFWHGGYYMGKQLGEWSGVYGSQATQQKVSLGKVKHYYKKAKIAEVIVETGTVEENEPILVIGPTTGVVETNVLSIYKDEVPVKKAEKGDLVTVPIPEIVRENDQVFKVIKKE